MCNTVQAGLQYCQQWIAQGQERAGKLAEKIKTFLLEQAQKLPDQQTVWHCSSDVLESLFGSYKSRKAPNALHGVTSLVLLLPLLTKISSDKTGVAIDCKQALEDVSLADLRTWEKQILPENQVLKRNRALKN